jgi:hypothetical protein
MVFGGVRNGQVMTMANEEQLAILKQGAEKWNEWRTNH